MDMGFLGLLCALLLLVCDDMGWGWDGWRTLDMPFAVLILVGDMVGSLESYML